jgi:uncharacterized protein YukE
MPHHDEPNWKDVRWDHGAADAAVGALGRAAALLDASIADEGRIGQEASAEWRGGTREEFERRRRLLREELASLANACRDAAAGVRQASALAEQEQRRREREREEWEREQERRRGRNG